MDNRIELRNATAQITRTSGPDGEPFRLRVHDRLSGVLIVDLELDDHAFADLLSTRVAEATIATAATAEQYAHVGMRRTVASERVPRDRVGHLGRDETREALTPYAEERREALGADAVRIDSGRDGWSLSFSTWTADA